MSRFGSAIQYPGKNELVKLNGFITGSAVMHIFIYFGQNAYGIIIGFYHYLKFVVLSFCRTYQI